MVELGLLRVWSGGWACLLEAMWQNWCVRLVGWCVGGC
jgi:hypothetical protein